MRIGIDARMLDNTGIGRYLRNVLIHLADLDTQNEYRIFINDENTRVVEQENFTFVTLHPPIPVYSLREQSRFPFEIRRRNLDVMHYPNFDIPLIQSCPYIVTIHDLIYYLHPEQCPSKLAHYYATFMLKSATKHAQTVVTDSEHSRQDLLRHLHLPSENVRVIFPAAEATYTPVSKQQAPSEMKKTYGITLPYILYVGKHHPYKNVKQLLYAYTRQQHIYQSFQLVIAGKRDPRWHDLYESAEALDPQGHILFTDSVPEDELPNLYREATLFVFPSTYEGFGLPPLEAMASGVPVVCSNAASLPEVVGEAALLVDPSNTEEMANAIQRALTDTALRNTLKEKGLQQAQKFSWKTSARQHLQLYQQVV